MWGETKNAPGLISFVLVCTLVLATTLFIGQVLGSYYLANIQREPQVAVEQRRISSRGDSLNDDELREKAQQAQQTQQALSNQTNQTNQANRTAPTNPTNATKPTHEQNQSNQEMKASQEKQANQGNEGNKANPTGQSKKKKVLRLKQEQYYTIVLAESPHREEALQLGQRLGQQGLPVIITAEAPYQVLLGFVNNETKLAILAQRIKINEKAVRISCETLNKVAFKFLADDLFAAGTLAPYLGKMNVCLSKGLQLYQNITVADEGMIAVRSKYGVLAAALKQVAAEGEKIAAEGEKIPVENVAGENVGASLKRLAGLCRVWGQSLEELGKEWGDAQLLKSQQQALVLLEEYHRFLRTTN